MLVYFALGDAISCVGHVHFILCVYISFASGSQRGPHLQWNIGGVGSSGVGHVRRGKFQWNMDLK